MLLAGLFRLWQIPATVSADRHASDSVTARVEPEGGAALTVSWRRESFGIVWLVETEGRRTRTYPSVNGLIRDLRERLVPERGSARVLFAGRAGDAP